jgi:hypothetical protein
MFESDESCLNLELLGEEIHERSWQLYGSEFVSGVQSRRAYYTSFRGFEVLFHIAPLLTEDERRQHIGNDKVLIYCLEEGATPLVPGFRGDVNSVGIACQPVGGVAKWNVSIFCRSRLETFEPVFVGRNLDLSQLRETVLTLAITGHLAVVTSLPYLGMLCRVMEAEFKMIWPPRDKQRRASAVRRSLTTTTIRQSSNGERSSSKMRRLHLVRRHLEADRCFCYFLHRHHLRLKARLEMSLFRAFPFA